MKKTIPDLFFKCLGAEIFFNKWNHHTMKNNSNCSRKLTGKNILFQIDVNWFKVEASKYSASKLSPKHLNLKNYWQKHKNRSELNVKKHTGSHVVNVMHCWVEKLIIRIFLSFKRKYYNSR